MKLIHEDCLEWMQSQPDNITDMTFGSPPYEAARTYGIDFSLTGQDWVDWMTVRIREMVRITKGLVAMVIEGQTRNFAWSVTPALLMSDLHRTGICLRKPPIFRRIGIPGSGGPDWLRNDYEFIVCCTSGGKLPWSDNTSMGNAPKWAPGGEMSHRAFSGIRVKKFPCSKRSHTKSRADGTDEIQHYSPPKIANPGNIIHCHVGGGNMGSSLSHKNEAPFPEKLAEFFVLSFCRPSGTVLDPFCGSGTTGAAALKNNRNFIGIDIRENQIKLSKTRLSEIQPVMF